MEYFGYKLRIATRYHAILYKKFEHNNIIINQVIKLSLCVDNHSANVELGISDTYIDQTLLDTLQIALNRTKRDIRENADAMVSLIKGKYTQIRKGGNENGCIR